MKKLSIALINLPLLALGTALAQTPTAVDYDDMLSPARAGLESASRSQSRVDVDDERSGRSCS